MASPTVNLLIGPAVSMLAGPAVNLFVGPAVNSLQSVVSENIKLITGFEKQLGRLKDEVEMSQAVLHDAERRSPQDESVKLWLKKLVDFAYEATDVLDEFAYHALRRKVEVSHSLPSSSKSSLLPKIKVALKRKDSSKPSFLSKRKMGKKMKKLLTSLESINKQASDYGLQTGGGDVRASPLYVDRETTSFVDTTEVVVGREDDITKIVQMLTSEGNQQTLSVLPIVGMGGQEKTTLAKQIYNNNRVENHFQKRMWVCVSDEFNVKSLLKEILETLVKKKCELNTKETILNELHEGLVGQKYLLVLDDVWEENQENWDKFVSDLQSASTSGGNAILVTTRSTRVGKLVGTFDKPYSLERLSDDHCWSIFSARAFPNGVLGGFEAVGREIAIKCGGLPLAAKVVGSMLRDTKELREWRSIANSGAWNVDGDKDGVLEILKLSYDILPSPSLKHCFSYCSIFRKDSVMRKDELIQQWMALGYLQPLEEHNNIKIEDIGNSYFNILVERSLFQDITTTESFYGPNVSCKMHDLVHDVTQLLSKPDVFVVEGGAELERGAIPRDIRHLALYSDGVNLDTIGHQGGDKLRTLFLGKFEIGKGFLDFKCLRILKLHQINELPTSINDLIHLRFLDLSETEIKVLPDAITKLYHLQTLRLPFVKYLPDGMRDLISLRHLYLRPYGWVKMPLKLGSLTCLQTLGFFIIGEEKGHQIEELGSLENLSEKLEIWNLEKVRSKEDAERANLSEKTKIDKLELRWNMKEELDNKIETNVLEGLQPHRNLKSLCIVSFGGRNFPDWVMNMAVNVGGSQLLLDNLVDIQLIKCNRVEGIPMLGHLPFLRRLRLQGMNKIKCIGESFYGYKDSSSSRMSCGVETIKLFPALEEFGLEDMEDLEEWMGATASQEEVVMFPCLETLTISRCEKLKTTPIHFPCLMKFSLEQVNSRSPLVSICSISNKLTSLFVGYVRELIYLPDGLFFNNRHHLMNLRFIGCDMLESLPQGLQSCTSLRSLTIENCCKLKSIPSLEGLNSLIDLRCFGCEMLESLPQDLQSCTSLSNLIISSCHKLKSIPSLEGLNSLTNLECSYCEMLESLPQGLQFLRSLDVRNCENLNLMASVEDINGCPKVTSLPSLETLKIGETNSFKDIQHLLQQCVSLRHLELVGQPECDTLPQSLQYLTALTSMELRDFGVETLPDWLGKLVSLEAIRLVSMEKLKYLPSKEAIRQLTKLRRLDVFNCPLLKARCKEGGHPEWSKISNIPTVVLL